MRCSNKVFGACSGNHDIECLTPNTDSEIGLEFESGTAFSQPRPTPDITSPFTL